MNLTATAIKLFAVFAMLVDHIAWAFVPTYSIPGQVMHIVGRTTAPIMCYFIAEGYFHTHDLKRYAGRLFFFALLSQVPFAFFEFGPQMCARLFDNLNVIYTLFIGLLALYVWDRVRPPSLRFLLIVGLCLLAVPGDWDYIAVLFILSFGANRGRIHRQILCFSGAALLNMATFAVPYLLYPIAHPGAMTGGMLFWDYLFKNAYQLAVFLALIPLSLYHGERGGKRGAGKWLFYWFYPVHLVVIGLVRLLSVAP